MNAVLETVMYAMLSTVNTNLLIIPFYDHDIVTIYIICFVTISVMLSYRLSNRFC